LEFTKRIYQHGFDEATDWVNNDFNMFSPQKNIGHQIPIKKLKEWAETRPELFKKRV